MAQSPAKWFDPNGLERLNGTLDGDFGGLPTGWTEDDSDPASVNTHGGALAFDDDGNVTATAAGYFSQPGAGHPAFSAFGDSGATVALDGDGLLLSNVVPDETIAYASTAAAAPTTFTTPIYYDSTAVSGGLYAWDGSAYIQIGGLIA